MKKFAAIFRNKELVNRIFFTVMVLFVLRIGAQIYVPGVSVNQAKLAELTNSGSTLALMDLLGGGALSNFSVFALGVSPYITAQIIIQLLSKDVLPALTELSKQGEYGRKKIEMATRYLTLLLGAVQGYGIIKTMDRSILEGNPFEVIEGMMIAGYAYGASEGYFYVRAEYPVAVARLLRAISDLEKVGLLGDNILGTNFSFHVHLREGAGAFVCGEETALLNSIEGKRGMPRPRPPFPAIKGLWGKPTCVNNVETLAQIPYILRVGAAQYASVGTQGSKGTKVFALGGKINNVGLVEVPMGTTLRTLIFDVGGGIPNGKKFKAIQTGGPSGGCLTEEDLDTPIDYDTLIARGSMMGSGGAIVMDEDNCMVDVAHFYMDFITSESCGKCSPCRIGTKRLYEMLTQITNGQGTFKTLDDMKELAEVIKQGSLCALGQTAANPILSTLKKFPEEYRAHVEDKKCPSHVCKKLMQFYIDPVLCKKCSKCARNCPVNCISGVPGKEPYVIDQSKCIKCGTCMAGCPFHAISKR